MADRFAYERSILSDRILVETMSIEELAAIPVSGTSEDPKHTVYDGSVVLFEAALGVLCAGALTIEILGPYWDRIYRLEFTGMRVTQATDSQLLRGVDVKQISLGTSPEGARVFSMTEMFDEGTISIEFESATVTHYSLRESLKRLGGGINSSELN